MVSRAANVLALVPVPAVPAVDNRHTLVVAAAKAPLPFEAVSLAEQRALLRPYIIDGKPGLRAKSLLANFSRFKRDMIFLDVGGEYTRQRAASGPAPPQVIDELM